MEASAALAVSAVEGSGVVVVAAGEEAVAWATEGAVSAEGDSVAEDAGAVDSAAEDAGAEAVSAVEGSGAGVVAAVEEAAASAKGAAVSAEGDSVAEDAGV